MYARDVDGKQLTFDFAEGLINDNLLFVDRETRSIWSQLHGKAVSGPMENKPLKVIPSMQTTWKQWRQLHPETKVLNVPGKQGYRYLYRNRKPGTPPPKQRPQTHDTSALGLGLVVHGQAMYFPFAELQKSKTPLTLKIGGQPVNIHFADDGLSAWAENESGELLPGVLSYKDGWLSFYPESKIFRAGTENEKKE